MDDNLLIKVAAVFVVLVLIGIALTVYEFREHIMEQHRKRKQQKKKNNNPT